MLQTIWRLLLCLYFVSELFLMTTPFLLLSARFIYLNLYPQMFWRFRSDIRSYWCREADHEFFLPTIPKIYRWRQLFVILMRILGLIGFAHETLLVLRENAYISRKLLISVYETSKVVPMKCDWAQYDRYQLPLTLIIGFVWHHCQSLYH